MMMSFRTTVCIAALCAGTGAMADVTAVEVWEEWNKNFDRSPQTSVTIGNEEIADGVVTITDLALSILDEDETVSANLGTVTFTEQGDGTVAITMGESIPVEIQSSDAESVILELSQSGLQIVVSGDEQSKNYNISAARYKIAVVEALESGEPAIDGELSLAMNNLAGSLVITSDDMQRISQDLTIGSVELLTDVTEPGGKETLLLSGKIENVAAKTILDLPLEMDDQDDLFKDGLSVIAGYSFEAANFIFDVDAEGSTSVGSITLGNGLTNLAMNADQLAYGVGANTMAINVESSDLPLPVSINLSEIGTGLVMPLSVTEAPEDFTMSLKLTDLTANDEIWDLGDPTRVLSRDPITVDLGFSGKAKLFFDILDPAQEAARNQAEVPGEIHAFSIDSLLVSAAGAMLTGSGAFTFDNDDLATFDGFPRPLGKATFEMTGANMLIDNLVSMNLLPEDQASMGRMMMGMFARSVGDDQLQTTVEVNDQAHLIVNGQRMQ